MLRNSMTNALISVMSLSALLLGCGTPASNQTEVSSNSNESAINNNLTDTAQTAWGTTKAPTFTLPTFDGTTLSLQQLLAKREPIVVNYFASWCPPCNAEMPDFTSVSNQFSGKAQFLGVDSIGEDSSNGVKGFVKKYNIKFPVVLDERNILASQYGLAGHPETVIIAPNGTIAWAYPGPVSKDLLVRTLNQVLKQKTS